MTYTENEYVNIGYKYERSKPSAAVKIRKEIIAMLADESEKDQLYAQTLIEQGRQEARR